MPSVTIAAHQRGYDDRKVDLAGATLTTYDDGTSMAAGDTAFVYYDDPTRKAATVTYKATKTYASAITSGTNPWRHYVGSVTIPASGTTSGSQANPGSTGGSVTTPLP